MFDSPFTSYAYSYPHKSAYREFAPAIGLSEVWAEQKQDALCLYLHLPFCEFRCGFCNLFTLSQPGGDLPKTYLSALRRQAVQVRRALPNARFARLAIGGGTPTFLSLGELKQLMSIVTDVMGARAEAIPSGCEASPSTVDRDKLALLREFGIDRLSLGVQSFDDREVHAIGRPQRAGDVERAIDLIKDAGFRTLNLDLIYGGEGQSVASWMRSVQRAIEHSPAEIYLYPLYVRRATGLGNVSDLADLSDGQRRLWDLQRLSCYREARELLLKEGYQQVSLRMFQSSSTSELDAPCEPRCETRIGPVYCCQTDAMVGLGCGARSYTDRLHYSYEYAVSSKIVQKILGDYVRRDDESFSTTNYGFWLDGEDRRRRHLVMSLLQCEGMSRRDYEARFGTSPLDDFPALGQLHSAGYLQTSEERIVLTETGIEYSDAIGPWLRSAKVQRLEASYQWR